ncbi:MAG: hypothetical protein IKE28_02840 [Solobacterium sp.]|nr:hypothetical protein [Solobacterium sp.]
MNTLYKKKYRLIFSRPGFQSEKTSYAEGETVTVSYMVATDTDYWFQIDAEDVKQSYDPRKGMIHTFTMPAHDVKVNVTSGNTMERDPNAC